MAALQTPVQQHQATASNVAKNLQIAGHAVGTQDVIPATSDTPIPKTPEMHELGAEVIGEDLAHVIGTTIGDLTTGTHKYRITKSGRFLDMLKGKLLRRG